MNGVATERLSPAAIPPARAIALVERGGTIWLALDRYLVALRAGEEPEIPGWDHGFESGGPLLVDREESLWLGTFSGLLQFPEPETRTWAERKACHRATSLPCQVGQRRVGIHLAGRRPTA